VPTFFASTIEDLGTSIFRVLDVPEDNASLVSRELVRTHRMGFASHGVIRFLQYARDLRSGLARPNAPVEVASDSGATAIVDCGDALGIVAAYQALAVAIQKARDHGLGLVITRHCNHVGRLGSYTEAAARQGYVCVAGAAIPKLGHFVLPWGGSEGRLGTNPFAYGAPTTADPIIGDFATSVIPEGRVRSARNSGELIPEGAATDASGRPTRDPAAFYGPPMGGLLPFGGPVGYKGHALGLFVELLGGTLAGDDPAADDRQINALWLLVIDPGRFLPSGRFPEVADELVAYVRSSVPAPGVDRVRIPGEREFDALGNGDGPQLMTIDDETWNQLRALGEELAIDVPSPISGASWD
jgi:uncharacterized oxidoreductase